MTTEQLQDMKKAMEFYAWAYGRDEYLFGNEDRKWVYIDDYGEETVVPNRKVYEAFLTYKASKQ